MFGIGFPELIVICIVALIFIGPQKLPELMRQGGKLFVQLRRTTNDVRSTFDQVVHEAEEEMRRAEAEALRQAILADHVKSPKLLEANPVEPTPDQHQVDPDTSHEHDTSHSPDLHPDRPEGAQPFQPNLLGGGQTASPAPAKQVAQVADQTAVTPDAITKPKDSTNT